MPPLGMKQKRIPSDMVIAIRNEYELGLADIPDLAKKYKLSKGALYNRSTKEKWLKASKTKELEVVVERDIMAHAAELGFPKEKYVKLLIDGMTKPDKLEYSGEKDPATGKFKPETLIVTPIPDYDMRLKYIVEFGKLTGQYKQLEEKTVNQTSIIGPTILLPDNGRDRPPQQDPNVRESD